MQIKQCAACIIMHIYLSSDVDPNQTIPAAGNTSSTPASNNSTSAVHIYDTG